MENTSDLTVVTVVENDCGGIFDLMIRSVKKFTDPSPSILICNNGSGNALDKYRNDGLIRIINNSPALRGGSNRHGDALNKIIPMVKTKRTAIVESDCIVLNHMWHKTSKRMVAAKKAENSNLIAYHVCFMIFDTVLLQDVDFRAGTDKTRSNRSYQWWEDVGWRVSSKANPKDIEYLKFIDCKSGNGKYFDSRFQSDEFWLGDVPVVAHFGRGSNIAQKAIRENFKHPIEQREEWKKIAEEILK